MSCSKCKDGFVTSALLGRVACLACRDARIDGEPKLAVSIESEIPVGDKENHLGIRDFGRIFLSAEGFAIWVEKSGWGFSHHLPPPQHGHLRQLFNASESPEEYRLWLCTDKTIGGHHTAIDVSSMFGAGAVASIDADWNVRLELQCSTVASFRLTDNSPNGRRFRRAIKLPEPRVYT